MIEKKDNGNGNLDPATIKIDGELEKKLQIPLSITPQTPNDKIVEIPTEVYPVPVEEEHGKNTNAPLNLYKLIK